MAAVRKMDRVRILVHLRAACTASDMHCLNWSIVQYSHPPSIVLLLPDLFTMQHALYFYLSNQPPVGGLALRALQSPCASLCSMTKSTGDRKVTCSVQGVSKEETHHWWKNNCQAGDNLTKWHCQQASTAVVLQAGVEWKILYCMFTVKYGH